MRVWHILAELIERHGRCAMVTVVEVKGSAPREEGARLFVVEGGNYRGTIGGGALEWRALAEAQEVLNRRSGAKVLGATLGPDLGQCCGGHVRLLIETLDGDDLPVVREMMALEKAGRFATFGRIVAGKVHRRVTSEPAGRSAARFISPAALIEEFGEDHRSIFLFGAGHVGRALVLALAPLPFAVTWVDSRREAFPRATPSNVSVLPSTDPGEVAASAPPGALAVIMTHSHAMDLAITARALAVKHVPYVGVIGSATKRARFLSRLRSAGLVESELCRFVCPIGLSGIRSKLPAVIAASVAADLVARDEMLRASSTSQLLVHKSA
jgi:xanthine dehydrogenase accessory factor